MFTRYDPNNDFVAVVLDELTSSLPFVARIAVKAIPRGLKLPVLTESLAYALPLSFGGLALTQKEDARVVLTKAGVLTEEAKSGFLKRIAFWLVPNEVANLTSAVQKEIARLAKEEFLTEAWHLRIVDGEVVIDVLDTSLLRASADTVADAFLSSFESLKGIKAKIFSLLNKKS